jgi:glutathione S-transferase
MGLIYHIAAAADWKRAQAEGTYTTSTRGLSLAEVGFIHTSRAHQVATVANTFYRGDHDLLLLTIDEDLVAAEIRYEEVPGAADPFPHIYGPLDVTAVVRAVPFAPGPDGSFSFAAGPSS